MHPFSRGRSRSCKLQITIEVRGSTNSLEPSPGNQVESAARLSEQVKSWVLSVLAGARIGNNIVATSVCINLMRWKSGQGVWGVCMVWNEE